MVMLKGIPLALDDLIGFSKLTDALQKICEAFNAQELSIQELRSDLDSTQGRVAAQDAVVEQARRDLESTMRKVEASLSAQDGLMQKQNARFDSLQAQLQQLLDRDKTIEGLQTALKAVQKKTEAVENQQKALEEGQKTANSAAGDAMARIEAVETGVNKLKKQLEMELSDVSEKVQQVGERLEKVDKTLASHEERMGGMTEAQRQTNMALDQAKDDSVASVKSVEDKVADLNSTLSATVEDLMEQLSKAGNAEEMKKLSEDIRRLEGQLRELRSQQGGVAQLRQMLDALSDKEASDVGRLTKEVNILQNRMVGFMDKGASATARCLSCFDRRSQLHNTIVVGTDGKTYLRSPDGAPIGKLHIPNPPGRVGSPPGRTAPGSPPSPPRGRPYGTGLSAPPPVMRPATSLPALN